MAEGAAVLAIDGPADLVAGFEGDIRGVEHFDQRAIKILGHYGGEHGLRFEGIGGILDQKQLVHAVIQQNLFGIKL